MLGGDHGREERSDNCEEDDTELADVQATETGRCRVWEVEGKWHLEQTMMKGFVKM